MTETEKELTVEQGNEIIGRFMKESNLFRPGKPLSYHKKWEFLMPVVEKIESIGDNKLISNSFHKREIINFNVDIINKNMVEILGNGNTPVVLIDQPLGLKKIEAVWMAVVKFIQWYNSQKKINP